MACPCVLLYVVFILFCCMFLHTAASHIVCLRLAWLFLLLSVEVHCDKDTYYSTSSLSNGYSFIISHTAFLACNFFILMRRLVEWGFSFLFLCTCAQIVVHHWIFLFSRLFTSLQFSHIGEFLLGNHERDADVV
jgi:hypothetical protein